MTYERIIGFQPLIFALTLGEHQRDIRLRMRHSRGRDQRR
jgi:hypothetical protein